MKKLRKGGAGGGGGLMKLTKLNGHTISSTYLDNRLQVQLLYPKLSSSPKFNIPVAFLV